MRIKSQPFFHKILIIQTAFKGDVILASSLIEKLSEISPKPTIDFLLRKGNEDLLENNPHLNRVWILDKKKSKYKHVLNLIRAFRKEKYDLILNIQRYFTTGMITAFSGAKTTIGFNKNPLSWAFSKSIQHIIEPGVHEVNRNQSLISFFTDDIPSRPKLYYNKKVEEKVNEYLTDKFITISPSSVWFTKRYPLEKWVEAINNMSHDLTIYLLGGPDEFDECEEIRKESVHPNLINKAGSLNLNESAFLMEKAVMNFVNDSAPMHVASAGNSPTTAIYCSTIPEFGYGPLSSDSTILQVKEKLSCRPCGLHGHQACPEKHFKCSEIDPMELVKIVNQRL